MFASEYHVFTNKSNNFTEMFMVNKNVSTYYQKMEIFGKNNKEISQHTG